MDDIFPTMRTLDIADAQAALPELAGAVGRHEARVVLAQDGEPVAVLMSLLDLERILDIQLARIALMEFQDRATEAFADVSEEELQAETDRIISSLRAANRASSDLAATG
ncbi:MAG: type II toxin-antitoxin system Phd/YefM family antitoxin [Chloroflexota bacterium]|nr:type II toxin-antitoxin system Phd/YefM family antitoxin [Chloroflexota bacterium]